MSATRPTTASLESIDSPCLAIEYVLERKGFEMVRFESTHSVFGLFNRPWRASHAVTLPLTYHGLRQGQHSPALSSSLQAPAP